MKRQRKTTEMKKQIRNTEVQINEEEIGKLPEKEFNLEAWEKETSSHSKLKKNNENAEKYYTNEGTNQKHRSPNK